MDARVLVVREHHEVYQAIVGAVSINVMNFMLGIAFFEIEERHGHEHRTVHAFLVGHAAAATASRRVLLFGLVGDLVAPVREHHARLGAVDEAHVASIRHEKRREAAVHLAPLLGHRPFEVGDGVAGRFHASASVCAPSAGVQRDAVGVAKIFGWSESLAIEP